MIGRIFFAVIKTNAQILSAGLGPILRPVAKRIRWFMQDLEDHTTIAIMRDPTCILPHRDRQETINTTMAKIKQRHADRQVRS